MKNINIDIDIVEKHYDIISNYLMENDDARPNYFTKLDLKTRANIINLKCYINSSTNLLLKSILND